MRKKKRMKTVEEIRELVVQLDRKYQKRNDQFKIDERMYWLEGEESEVEGTETIIFPIPHNVINTACDLLSSNPMRITVPPPSEHKKPKDRADKMENFLDIAWDRMQRDANRRFISDMAFFISLRGQMFARVLYDPDLIGTDGEGDDRAVTFKGLPIFCQIIDPFNVYPLIGSRGLESYIIKMTVEAGPIMQQFDVSLKHEEGDLAGEELEWTDEIEWVEYWDDEMKCFLANSQEVMAPTKHEYGFCPGVYGWGRTVPSKDPEKQGVSMLFGLRGIVRRMNRLATMVATSVYENALGTIIVHSDRGEEVQLDMTPGSINYLFQEEKAEWFAKGQLSSEQLVLRLNDVLQDQAFQSTFPPVVTGATPWAGTPGYAISLLTHSGKLKIAPLKEQLEWALSNLNEHILRLVEVIGEKIPIQGVRAGTTYDMKFGPGDVKGYYSNVVKLEVDMPQDEMRNMQMARLATEGPDPILSKETSREKYLKIQSPAKEQQRIDLEWIIGNPAIREALAALLAIEYGYLPKPPGAEEREKAPGPPVGAPEQGLGVPAQVLPPGETPIGQPSPGPRPPGTQGMQVPMV